MEYTSVSESLVSGLINGTIVAGFIWLLFRPGKLERLFLICIVLTSIFTFLFGSFIPSPFTIFR